MEYDYPLVTESGVTFVSDADLLRFIREKCGDEICRFLEKKLGQAESAEKIRASIRRSLDCLWDINFSDLESLMTQAVDILEKEAGVSS